MGVIGVASCTRLLSRRVLFMKSGSQSEESDRGATADRSLAVSPLLRVGQLVCSEYSLLQLGSSDFVPCTYNLARALALLLKFLSGFSC